MKGQLTPERVAALKIGDRVGIHDSGEIGTVVRRTATQLVIRGQYNREVRARISDGRLIGRSSVHRDRWLYASNAPAVIFRRVESEISSLDYELTEIFRKRRHRTENDAPDAFLLRLAHAVEQARRRVSEIQNEGRE